MNTFGGFKWRAQLIWGGRNLGAQFVIGCGGIGLEQSRSNDGGCGIEGGIKEVEQAVKPIDQFEEARKYDG